MHHLARRIQWLRYLGGMAVAVVGMLWLPAGNVGAVGLPTPMIRPTDAGPWLGVNPAAQSRRLEAEMKTRAMLAHRRTTEGMTKASAGMESYDVHFYDLELDLDPTAKILTGTVTVAAEVTAASLAVLELNMSLNLNVAAAQSGGLPAGTSRLNDVLSITLDRTYTEGETVVVTIDYWGNPESSSNDYFGWDSYGGQPLIWTLSEPYGARQWWPCKDLNTDKADSVALHITVPDGLIATSNGVLEQTTVPAPGRTTFHWFERFPIATYLVAVTAHPYAVFTDRYVSAAGDTMPLEYYVMADRLATSMDQYAPVPTMIQAFAGLYGEYPFVSEKYGHVQFLWGGGMEHQTMTSLYNALSNSISGGIIAHELAHQWFGDMVTCADFSHIWINEGFATWSEAYWREQSEGIAAYHDEMNDARYLGPGTIIVEDPGNFNAIFSWSLTYQKASWVPHMLRHVVGETAFMAGLHRLLSDHAYDSVTTADVQAAFEAESGQDLGAFFQQWIYGEYYPAYALSWAATPVGAESLVRVRIAQTQTNTGLFTMPLDVRIASTLGDTTFVVHNSQAEQWYELVVDGAVSDVQLDPDNWVLRTVSYEGISAAPTMPTAGSMQLLANAPNPFNPRTEIRFRLASPQTVTLTVHDVAGRVVRKLVAGSFGAGEHRVIWDGIDSAGRTVASGTYFARLQGSAAPQVRPLTLIR